MHYYKYFLVWNLHVVIICLKEWLEETESPMFKAKAAWDFTNLIFFATMKQIWIIHFLLCNSSLILDSLPKSRTNVACVLIKFNMAVIICQLSSVLHWPQSHIWWSTPGVPGSPCSQIYKMCAVGWGAENTYYPFYFTLDFLARHWSHYTQSFWLYHLSISTDLYLPFFFKKRSIFFPFPLEFSCLQISELSCKRQFLSLSHT